MLVEGEEKEAGLSGTLGCCCDVEAVEGVAAICACCCGNVVDNDVAGNEAETAPPARSQGFGGDTIWMRR